MICEFSKVTPPLRPFYKFYLKVAMPIVAKLASVNPIAYDYLGESIEAWPNQETLAQMIRDAGFENVSYKNLSFGIVAIHIGFKAGV